MKIDFYNINAISFNTGHPFACRLINKAYQHHHQITICCEAAMDAYELDDLLWCWYDASFIPHQIDIKQPFIIHVGLLSPVTNKILINLSLEKINEQPLWERLLQIIPNNTAAKQQAEELYHHYQEKGHDLTIHQMNT